MYRPSLKRAALASLVILPLLPATAEPPMEGDDALFAASGISDEELSEQRGGFQFAGMEIRLGADIRTFLNNELALHTVITMDENGYNRVQTVGAGLTLADADAIRNNVLSNGAIQLIVTNQTLTAITQGNVLNGDFLAGDVNLSDSALSSFNGVGNILINTGAQVSLQTGMNLTINIGE